MKFRKKPVVIDAYTSTSPNIKGLQTFVESFNDTFDSHFEFIDHGGDASLYVKTLEGKSYAVDPKRDVIIRGVAGEYYPCKRDIFEATYEPIKSPNQ